MNRYNPYSVPEDFFETVRIEALRRRDRTRRAIGLAAGALVLSGLLVAMPYLSGNQEPEQRLAVQEEENLNDMYNNDIFLLVSNF